MAQNNENTNCCDVRF